VITISIIIIAVVVAAILNSASIDICHTAYAATYSFSLMSKIKNIYII
jgi:hypothetical protein